MITGITLENFKGFRRVEIRPKQITAFVGPNGTGKSSALQAFGLLKQTVGKIDDFRPLPMPTRLWNGPTVTQGPLVCLPSLESLTSSFRKRSPVLSFEASLVPRSSGFGEGLVTRPRASSRFSYKVRFSQTMQIDVVSSAAEAVLTVRERRAFREIANALKMVLAVRALAQPAYGLEDDSVEDIFSIEGQGKQEAQTASNLAYSSDEVERVSHLLEKVTGTRLRADIVPPKSVEVKSLSKAGAINIVAEGFGTNSLIMLLLQLVSAERGATVMIEEPEIHLHPKAQADLAEVLAEEARDGDKQVIMTTHSEHITGRLLTLVAEGKLPIDDLAIYAFEKDIETGVCSAKPLKISQEGGIEGGIRDFFDVNLAEMNRYVEAQFARLNSSE